MNKMESTMKTEPSLYEAEEGLDISYLVKSEFERGEPSYQDMEAQNYIKSEAINVVEFPVLIKKEDIKHETDIDSEQSLDFELLTEIDVGKYECLPASSPDPLRETRSDSCVKTESPAEEKDDWRIDNPAGLPESSGIVNSRKAENSGKQRRLREKNARKGPKDGKGGKMSTRSKSRQKTDLADSGSTMCDSPSSVECGQKHVRKERKYIILPSIDPQMFRTEIVGGRKTLQCAICSYNTVRTCDLRKHLLTHTGERPFICCVCSSRHTTSNRLRAHFMIHTGEKPHKCKICTYSCIQVGSLKRHMRTHTNERPFSCNICSYSSAQSGDLTTHMRTHSGDKPFKCQICPYSCTQMGSLNRHVRTHTGERPFKCKICPYSCAHAGHLKRHVRTHTDERPYTCSKCSYACSVSSALRKHMAKHSSVKSFSCDQCDYRSVRLEYLTRHVSCKHGGQKRYGCAHCNYRANDKRSLVVHLYKLHKEQS